MAPAGCVALEEEIRGERGRTPEPRQRERAPASDEQILIPAKGQSERRDSLRAAQPVQELRRLSADVAIGVIEERRQIRSGVGVACDGAKNGRRPAAPCLDAQALPLEAPV